MPLIAKGNIEHDLITLWQMAFCRTVSTVQVTVKSCIYLSAMFLSVNCKEERNVAYDDTNGTH